VLAGKKISKDFIELGSQRKRLGRKLTSRRHDYFVWGNLYLDLSMLAY
jgi:hypothetical protein